ncbi:conserved protein of unknown function [Magnetospirillum sp. XM-1]|uniref:hypothetical protein n=1 Tax=Magnetospirillum sp. XM-1 TaxID=1663591 RepID=UPI00073DEB27|nr:hypothetical protein [Magnetospirillum sp. XM-1]CUW37137.1 conserved protein of unknown function [Magnetospirillum sp. XM-1]
MDLFDLLGDAAAIAANPIAGLAKVALDVAPDIAGLFGDDAEKAVSKLAGAVRSITGTEDPEKAREVLSDPNLVYQLRNQAQSFAHDERMAQITGAITTLTATLADRQDARSRDTEFIKAGRSNIRSNVLLITAGLGIVGGIGFMVFGHVDGNTAVGGCIISVVTLLAGKFGTAFDFEFGGSADSEQTRNLLAQAPPIGK